MSSTSHSGSQVRAPGQGHAKGEGDQHTASGKAEQGTNPKNEILDDNLVEGGLGHYEMDDNKAGHQKKNNANSGKQSSGQNSEQDQKEDAGTTKEGKQVA